MPKKKTVYQTDRAGMFSGEVDAWESFKEPGVFQMPAGAVETAPSSEIPAGQWPRWSGVAWELVNRPVPADEPSAAEKLTAFLLANPDVAALVNPPTA